MLHPRPVTVVIPVYGDLTATRECIESCLKHIDSRHQILIVNDASPEREMEKMIVEIAAGKNHVRYVHNPENLGFVRTCNRAVLELDQTDNDILLLNSDTVVTEGFLEEMIECLYASDRHAVCCPRSDNATILTFPPYGDLSSEQRYTAWKKHKDMLPRWAMLPTGVGFCMLIRRSIIDTFGLFDETYGRGYNEENDFCSRIGTFGYVTIAANHAFVFHKGKRSFGLEEASLELRNRATLMRRHPEYARRVEDYVKWEAHPLEQFAHMLESDPMRTPTVLFDLTQLPRTWNGSSEYALLLLDALMSLPDRPYDIRILADPPSVEYFDLSGKFPGCVWTSLPAGPCADLAFVPHQIFRSPQLYNLSRAAPRIAATMHDVIALRSNYLHDQDMQAGFELLWRFADGLIAVSECAREDIYAYASQWPALSSRPIDVIHHGLRTPTQSPLSAHEQRLLPTEPFVLLVGNAFKHKAIAEALNHIPSDMMTVVVGVKDNVAIRQNVIIFESGSLSQAFVDALYSRCRLLFFPSLYEAWGFPTVQAAMRGKPVILHDGPLCDEMARVFPIGHLLHRFTSFSDIPMLLRECWTLKHEPIVGPLRTWGDCARDTDAFFQKLLAASVDPRAVAKRVQFLRSLERERKASVPTPWFPPPGLRKATRYARMGLRFARRSIIQT